MNQKIQSALPVGLSIAGSLGVIGTTILAVKESPKYYEGLAKLGDKPTFGQKAKVFFKCYGPAIGVGAATIASISTSTIISKRTEASLSASLVLAKQGYNRYGNKVKEILGLDVHNKAVEKMSEEDKLEEAAYEEAEKRNEQIFWNRYIGFFAAKKEDVVEAIFGLNRRVCIEDPDSNWCTIEQFVEDSGAKVCNEKQYNLHKDDGWDTEYLCIMNDVAWIDYKFSDIKTNNDGVQYTILEFDAPEPFECPQCGYEVPNRPISTK